MRHKMVDDPESLVIDKINKLPAIFAVDGGYPFKGFHGLGFFRVGQIDKIDGFFGELSARC